MSSSRLTVDLFAEDRAHEEFLRPIIHRVADEEQTDVVIRVRSARGGHGRAIDEFKLYQSVLMTHGLSGASPDIVVVAVDGNCMTFAKKREQIQAATDASLSASVVAASPDPHVERWYVADPVSFAVVVGSQPVLGTAKCERDHYKGVLANAVRRGGHPPTLGGVEFAGELVAAMDLFRAGKNDRSFKAFIDDLRRELRKLRNARGDAAV